MVSMLMDYFNIHLECVTQLTSSNKIYIYYETSKAQVWAFLKAMDCFALSVIKVVCVHACGCWIGFGNVVLL